MRLPDLSKPVVLVKVEPQAHVGYVLVVLAVAIPLTLMCGAIAVRLGVEVDSDLLTRTVPWVVGSAVLAALWHWMLRKRGGIADEFVMASHGWWLAVHDAELILTDYNATEVHRLSRSSLETVQLVGDRLKLVFVDGTERPLTVSDDRDHQREFASFLA